MGNVSSIHTHRCFTVVAVLTFKYNTEHRYKPKSELEWIELRSKEIPGPKYDLNKQNQRKKRGQRFSTSNTRNFIDTAIFNRSCVPGPKYIPGSFDKYSKVNTVVTSEPLQWDVGGYNNDRISNSIDFLIQQAQVGHDTCCIDAKYTKRRKQKKSVSMKRQQKRAKAMSKSKQRDILLKMKEDELQEKKEGRKAIVPKEIFIVYFTVFTSNRTCIKSNISSTTTIPNQATLKSRRQ